MSNFALVFKSYEELQVPFTEEGYLNATAVAARFGKRPNDWLSLPDTQEYLNQLPGFLV
ncbi:MAG: KilA-N domain-containing protein [Gammaproteobacteria bacterium]|nr:KilA-N domain-containing protein [Gammaproteobacteria bacterium]